MRVEKLLTLSAALLLGGSIAMAAGTSSMSTTTHNLTGTISSINGSDIVVAHQYDGKKKDSTFVMNSATKKEGSLATGERATIHYQADNNQNVATDVKVNPSTKS